MDTKTEVSNFKGHEILAIKSGNYNRMSAGVSKWKEVLNHLDEIKAFVDKHDVKEAVDKKETKKALTKKAEPSVMADVKIDF